MTEKTVSGTTIIITGGAGGMGRAVAFGLMADGAAAVAVDIGEGPLAALADQAHSAGYGQQLLTIRADITDPSACEDIAAKARAQFGGHMALLNAAGLGMQTIRADYMSNPIKFWEADPAAFSRLMAVNWTGAFLMARALAPGMIEDGWGRIVNVTTSLDTMYRTAYTPYGMSKAALEAASASWAADLDGTGVTVNVLVPGGPTNTGFIPGSAPFDRSKLIQPEVMVAPMRFLASAASDGITSCRFVANDWDAALSPRDAAQTIAAPAAWPGAGTQAAWPDA